MAESVDVAIIGGGIAGASVAYFLAREGVRNVLVLERSAVSSGASGRASGLVGFLAAGHPVQAALLKASSDFYGSWESEIGGPPALNPVGSIALLRDEGMQEVLGEVEIMRAAGHDVRLLQPADLSDLVPGWQLEDVACALYSPVSGYIDPPMVTTALMNRARALGVRVYQGAEVQDITVSGDRVEGVRTTRGDIHAPLVIVAAGGWTAKVGRLVGADLPIWAVRHQVMHIKPPEELPWPFPACVDPANSVYFRPEPGGLFLAANSGPDDYPDEPAGDPERFDPAVGEWYGQWIMRRVVHRVPSMARAEIVGGHSGAYPKGPDDFPAVGPLPQAEGLYCICDTSGSGMTTSPALGRALAESIVRGSAYVDIAPFRPSRFMETAVGLEAKGRPAYRRAALAARIPWNA